MLPSDRPYYVGWGCRAMGHIVVFNAKLFGHIVCVRFPMAASTCMASYVTGGKEEGL